MPDQRVILVTGAGGTFGTRVAAALAGLPGLRIIGLDREPAEGVPPDLDFVQADLRNPALPELLLDEGVDTVVHLAFQESNRPDEQAFEANVSGTIKLLGACAAAGVRRVMLRSSTAVYGARPENSAFLTEERPLHGSRRWGSVRDLTEIEAACRDFAWQTPAISLTVLRFAPLIGPAASSPLARFLRQTWTPVLLGFDPMVQVLHEDDAVGAIVHAALHDTPGTFNIAAEGPLPLTQLLALAGRLPLPVPHLGAYWGRELAQAFGADFERYLPADPDYLRYSCVADLARMRQKFAFAPHYRAPEAVREFAAGQRLVNYRPDEAGRAAEEQRLRATIEHRRRAREQTAAGAGPLATGDRPSGDGEDADE